MIARAASALMLAGCLAGAPGGATRVAAADGPAWTEVKWPFLIDQWGLGRAFRCQAADCGREVMLYLRPKAGFCNCTTGIAEDDEIDRVGDLALFGRQSRAEGAGIPVTVAWMTGRSRLFVVEEANQLRRFALTVAIANKCDAIVATVVAESGVSRDIERAAIEFLGSAPVLRWAQATTGLQ